MQSFKNYIPVIAAAAAAIIFLAAMLIPEMTFTLVIISLVASIASYAAGKAYIRGNTIVFNVGLIADCIIMITAAVYIVALLLINSVVTEYVANIL